MRLATVRSSGLGTYGSSSRERRRKDFGQSRLLKPEGIELCRFSGTQPSSLPTRDPGYVGCNSRGAACIQSPRMRRADSKSDLGNVTEKWVE